MTAQASGLSRAGFDRLIARAIKLDEEGNERIDLERARAIADELGISASAWDAALRERESLVQAGGVPGAGFQPRGRVGIVAVAGLAAGGLSGALAAQLGEGVLLLGGMAVAAAVALVVRGLRRGSAGSTQVDLAAWWLSVAGGIMLGMRELHPDPMLLAAAAWAGCASVAFTLHRLIRRAPSPPPLADTPPG